MKYKGLTLAEILTALAIIGVVSALTIPTLAKSYKNRVFANSLQVSVANFEKAMHQMMSREGVDNLFDTNAWQEIVNNGTYSLNTHSVAPDRNAFRDSISINLPIASVSTLHATWNYNDLSGGNDISRPNPQPIVFTTENGVRYGIQINTKRTSINEATAYSRRVTYLSRAANYVIIDVNGDSNPNREGRDIFYYELSADGRLYPIGSREQCGYTDILNGGNQSYVDPSTLCVNNKDGSFCAAYLAENNYNMDY